MNKIGHIFFAVVFFTAIYYIVSKYLPIRPEYFIISLMICLLYALIPDLDKQDSWIKKKLDVIIFYCILVLGVFYFVNADVIYPIIILIGIEIMLLTTKHRGFLHTYAFALIISAPLLFVNFIYFGAAMIGIFSHLLIDKL